MFPSNALLAAADAGGYINALKLLPILVLVGIWAKLLAWADKDSMRAHLPREMLNSLIFCLGLIGFALFSLAHEIFYQRMFWLICGALLAASHQSLGGRRLSCGGWTRDRASGDAARHAAPDGASFPYCPAT